MQPGDHDMTPTLQELYWMPITARIKYTLCLLTRKVTVGQAPKYIADLLAGAAEISARSVAARQLMAISPFGGQD